MQQVTRTLRKSGRQCRDRIDLVAVSLGLTMAVIGGFLSMTIIGIVIGAPLDRRSHPAVDRSQA